MKWTFYILTFALLFCSCKKEKFKEGEKRLPNATERGRGMFACYIDNDTYIARRQPNVIYNRTTGYFFLENYNPYYDFQLFVYEDLFAPGTYAFDYTGEEVQRLGVFYGVDTLGTNKLDVSVLDLEKNILAGTFELDVRDHAGNKLEIRDGRFDLTISVID